MVNFYFKTKKVSNIMEYNITYKNKFIHLKLIFIFKLKEYKFDWLPLKRAKTIERSNNRKSKSLDDKLNLVEDKLTINSK